MTKKKKILIIVLSIVGAILIAGGITLAVLLTRDPEKPPKPAAGVIYQTESISIWSTFGSTYMDFEYIDEPETPEEGKHYGYVFNVKFFNDNKWEAWLIGNWEMNEAKTELTLTATWGSADNDVKLADATSGQPKKYTASNGKFTIGVIVPSDGKINFTLDPVANKVGSDKPAAHECAHICETCGKCTDADCTDTVCADKCEGHTPSVTVAEELVATADGKNAKLELMSDNSWTLSISYYEGGDYTPTASGEWAMDTTTYAITLTVTEDTANALAEDTYALAVNYETFKHSGTIHITITGVLDADFAFAAPTITPEPATVAEELTAAADGKNAKLELMSDNSWKLSISYYEGGDYTPTASGEWALNTTTYGITLTVTEDAANVLAKDTYELEVNYETFKHSGTIHITITGVLDADFVFAAPATPAA